MSTIPLVDEVGDPAALASVYEVPEVRAARAAQPLYEDALHRAGMPVRTAADVAVEAAAVRQRAEQTARRNAAHRAEIAAAAASALGVTR